MMQQLLPHRPEGSEPQSPLRAHVRKHPCVTCGDSPRKSNPIPYTHGATSNRAVHEDDLPCRLRSAVSARQSV
jgi:hypothetical protein